MTQSFQRREVLRLAAAGAAVLCGGAGAQGGNWPTRPVNMVVPFPAGGGTDAFARPLSAQFAKVTGQTLVIDNRGGAGGTVGASIAAKAQPDGYTLFMGAVHHAIAPSIYPKLDYDLEKDFVPLMLLANVPQVVVVNPRRVTANTLQELVAAAKRSPGKLNYGSAGAGTSHHLAGELFKLQTGTFITHIPYRGAGPALSDLIAGNVDLMFDGLGSSAQHIKGGRIKALMVAGSKRNPAFPDVPCAAEVGLPDYTVTTWYGLWAPKGTPADLQARIVDSMKKALASDELKAIWTQNGSEIPNLTMAPYGGFVNSEIKRWAAVVKASGAKLE
ncbi:tripartite-type tricarboxylate transporter receptor subunit TctC [Variovorax beijingensis]|uniref:Tripartite-type tricarboxylate transporter receptor subunit TctC n=2 Tax=Variovorax TaxID=34072 RepID=A0AAE4C0M2_VARPD|nr:MULTISPECIES: tripartite tricarboxylate transporter substrate binding protein [Variovorax]MBD9665053.1 tripartite tricarboxylate transporter substrate binding protein [Variovorax sp. VRV01]MDP9967272.1 tripartite-type tricarboxylate transporter receptor subunit TctC [Variovorax paradoxus]MDR6429319.1 tripartite-type tricarboxylate transporter receptor subunit TctC [Variovorax paradoxus]TWD76666.1 tripartite-type tricarboxylate transporter receptor subunit TctC [Variovorax beijingensis]